MGKKGKKDFKSYAMIFVIGVILTLITILGLLRPSIRKLSMEGEVEAHKVVVEHKRKRSRSGKKTRTTSGNEPTYYYNVNGKEYVYTLSYYTKASEETLKNKNKIYYDVNNPSDCISEYETTIRFTNILVIAIMLTLPIAGLKGMISAKKE